MAAVPTSWTYDDEKYLHSILFEYPELHKSHGKSISLFSGFEIVQEFMWHDNLVMTRSLIGRLVYTGGINYAVRSHLN